MNKVTSILLIGCILQFIENGGAEVNNGNTSGSTQLSSVNLSQMNDQLKNQGIGILKKCTAPEKMDEIHTKMNTFKEMIMNYTGTDESMLKPSNPEELLKLRHKLCETKFLEVEIKFIEDVTAILRKCIDKDFLPLLEKFSKFLIRSQNVFCSMKDEDILNLLKYHYNISSVDTSCLQSLSSHFTSCITSSNEIIELVEKSSSWQPFAMNIMDGGAKECGIYNSFQKCVVKIMEPCPDPTIANSMKVLFNFLYKSMNCDAT